MTPESGIIKSLQTVKDPLLGLTAKEMNVQASIEATQDQLVLHLTVGFPCGFLETDFKPLLLADLQSVFPGLQIRIHLHQDIKAYRTQLAGKGLRGVKNTIAVASGKGGVGKSSVTVNLAAALKRLGARVGILDADIYGPSMPLMLGGTKAIELAGEHYLPVDAHGLQSMSIGYLTSPNQALIWRGPMLAKSFIQLLDITLWDNLDYLFIDLPPGTGDIQLSLVQKIPLTAAIVVTTPQTVATMDAEKAISLFSKTGIDVLGLVENMSTHICSHCQFEETIFGSGGAASLARAHDCLVLGQLPLDTRIRQHCDEGSPIALEKRDALVDAFIKTAVKAAIELSKKPINYADKFPKIVIE